MKINNFEKISRLLLHDSDEFFYDVQVLRRGKDHPELPAANYNIKNFCIKGKDNLEKHKDEIIKLCEAFEARAYICISRKSNKQCMLKTMECLAQRLYTGDVKKPHSIWWHAVGVVKPSVTSWVVDVDEKNDELVKEICDWITNWHRHQLVKQVIDPIISIIPTISGFHIITRGFNSEEFWNNDKFMNIEIKKHGLTLLYA